MSRFSTDFAAVGLPQLQWALGQAATFTHAGTPAAVTAIVETEAEELADSADGEVLVGHLTARLAIGEVPARGLGDSLTLGGVVWSWTRDVESFAGSVICEFERTRPVDKSRQGRRVRR